jgi:hypothetical protein
MTSITTGGDLFASETSQAWSGIDLVRDLNQL